MKNLVVVESPAKAKTINKYLGKDYVVLASFGHIRQLPKKNGSVDTEDGFKIKYEINKTSQKHVKSLVDKMKTCDKLILASDPDREGEAIAWHVIEVLKQKKAIKNDTIVERVVFNAITKNTVEQAMKEARKIDMDLVNAQQARVALDYLVGFNLSPVLWRKLPGSRSAGRVQSVALRLICEKQAEILNFKSEEYWSIDVLIKTQNNEEIVAGLVSIDGKKLNKLSIKNEKEAKKIKLELEKEEYKVSNIEKKETRRNPFAPFTTSTLQQEASKKLGFSTKKTMSLAQKLYEGIDIGNGTQGLITYMRTDGVYTAPEAISAARNVIEKNYGKKYLPEKAIIYKNKIKNAQEAHEAIRPTDPNVLPENIKQYLTNDEYKLYDLIWKRLIASQMTSVILDQVSIDISTSKHILRATGSIMKFNGFYILYNETKEDEAEEKDLILPNVKIGEMLNFKKVIDKQHFTEPPAKYSEAGLVKKMEELGIGRPSTYANIISVLQDRGYVKLERKKFVAENRGIVVNAFLKSYFKKYVEYDYTAKLEDDLDIVSNGKKDWKQLLKEFWVPFKNNIEEIMKIKNSEVIEYISDILSSTIFGNDENGKIKNKCPDCNNGTLGLRIGKFGVFIACSNYPECKHTEQIVDAQQNEEEQEIQKFEARELGKISNKTIYLKKGPYGFYVQLGEDDKKNKPKRVGIPKNIDINTLDIKKAEMFLSLPRKLGEYNNNEIIANIGRFGPYISYDKKFYSLKNDDVYTISYDRAIEIIKKQKKT